MLMPDSQPSSRKATRHHSYLHGWFAVLSAAASSLAVTVLQPFRRMSWLLQGVRSKQPEADPASKNLAKLKDYHQLAKVTTTGSTSIPVGSVLVVEPAYLTTKHWKVLAACTNCGQDAR